MNQKNQLLQSLRVTIETRKKQITNLEKQLQLEKLEDRQDYEKKLELFKSELVSLENELELIR